MKKLIRILIIILVICIALGSLALAALWFDTQRSWRFPEPTGPYKVGLKELGLIDTSRIDPFAGNQTQKRKLLVWVYYPAQPSPQAAPLGYVDKFPNGLHQLSLMLSLPEFLFNPSKKVKTHLFLNAPVASGDSAYPVVLFSHGMGIGSVGQNCAQFEELASHGYVVVSIGHTYETSLALFPDGDVITADMPRWKQVLRQINIPASKSPLVLMGKTSSATRKDSLAYAYMRLTPILYESCIIWAQDTRFVVHQLKLLSLQPDTNPMYAKFDFSRLGIFGHSLGAMTAQKELVEDSQIVAGISYDAPPMPEAIEKGITKPMLFMACEQFRSANDPSFARAGRGAGLVVINGTTHFNYSDFSLSLDKPRFWKTVGFIGSIDGIRCEEIITSYTLAFFDRHLKGCEIDLGDLGSKYPEVSAQFH